MTTCTFAVAFAALSGGRLLPATGPDLFELTAFGVSLLVAAFLLRRLRG